MSERPADSTASTPPAEFQAPGPSPNNVPAPGGNKPYYPEEEFLILGLRAGGLSWMQICIVFNQSVPEERRRNRSAIKNKHRRLKESLQASQKSQPSLSQQSNIFPPLPNAERYGATFPYNLYDPALRWPSEMIPHSQTQNRNPSTHTDGNASLVRFGGRIKLEIKDSKSSKKAAMRNSQDKPTSNTAMTPKTATAPNPQMQNAANPAPYAPYPSRNVVVPWDLVRDLIQREMNLKDHVHRLEESVNRLGYMNQQERMAYNQLAEEYDHLKVSYTELVEHKTISKPDEYSDGSFRVPVPAAPSNFEKILNYQ
ncbi:hypothetical protein TSTA_084450 [Talaromyces stipitatus ATCC 10500]|uniref:Uncharacterized protein n=1 Tax=Talaromyces stipitatus (strain ATCC 10500 / CBS 375.48 / QM 6759 / NRRL 1006) TaxID=441959 RepID=B8M0B7_TALSN|nr:uncharacterized protein TSTA_084450 [Talaromyces stipitatus ATCC 10500]EED21214.1 hypothetical protein TSTA_084450 [Talaromyces stipitatus ATCC 10500]